VAERLGIDEPSVPALLDASRLTLGERRADRCVELIRDQPLTQRYQGPASATPGPDAVARNPTTG
jgi:hypothetical protein